MSTAKYLALLLVTEAQQKNFKAQDLLLPYRCRSPVRSSDLGDVGLFLKSFAASPEKVIKWTFYPL